MDDDRCCRLASIVNLHFLVIKPYLLFDRSPGDPRRQGRPDLNGTQFSPRRSMLALKKSQNDSASSIALTIRRQAGTDFVTL
jgi:hypothetical protein